MNRKNRMKPWELKAQRERPKGFFSRIWHKIRGCLVWVGAVIAAIADFILSLF